MVDQVPATAGDASAEVDIGLEYIPFDQPSFVVDAICAVYSQSK
jgi:hypothetical protein